MKKYVIPFLILLTLFHQGQLAQAKQLMKTGLYFCEIPQHIDGSRAKSCIDGDGTTRECLGYKMILDDTKLLWNVGNETGVWKEIYRVSNKISASDKEETVISKVFALHVDSKPHPALMAVSIDINSPNNVNVIGGINYQKTGKVKNLRFSGPHITYSRCEFIG